MSEDRKENSAAAGSPPGVIFGLSAGEDCLELVLDPQNRDTPPQDVQHPFVTIADGGVFSRLLLAQVSSAGGPAVPVALKIQKDIPTLPTAPGFGRSFTNGTATAAFKREAVCRRDLAENTEGIVPTASAAIARLPITSLPVTYCKKVGAYFHPVCPACGGFLEDCRDEMLLGQARLPSYAESTRRFLYCPSCRSQKDAPPTFYTAAGSLPTVSGDAHVLTGPELYRDFGRLVASLKENRDQSDTLAPSCQQFSCLGCPHQAGCYPTREDETRSIPAEKMLYPVAYHEFSAIVRKLFELHYGEFCRLAGGRPFEEIKPGLAQRIPPAALPEHTARLEKKYGSPFKYFFGDTDGKRSAVEILWLKLGAFEQLCAELAEIYEKCNRPHLGLQPDTVVVSGGDPSPGQPALWSFKVGIANPAAAIPADLEGFINASGEPGFLNGPAGNRLYTSPMIRRPPYGHEEYANATIRAVEQGGAGLEINVDLVAEVIGVFKLTARDRLKVSLNFPAGKLDGFTFWADGAQPISGGFRVLGRTGHLAPDLAETLKSAVGQTLWDCRVNICRDYHVACDIYSLGMLWFSTILVNDVHDEALICRLVEDVGRKLASFAAAGNPTPDEVECKLGELLAEDRAHFAPEAVFYQSADRQAGAEDLPDELWFACQKLGMAMITGIAGFSVCAPQGKIDRAKPPECIKIIRDRLNDLNLWAEGQLFARKVLRREMQTVVSI